MPEDVKRKCTEYSDVLNLARQSEFQNEIFVLVFQKRVLELLVYVKANQERLGRACEPKYSHFFCETF